METDIEKIKKLKRAVDDLNLWTDLKVSLASSQEVGKSLHAVNLLMKNHKGMQQEISIHEHKVSDIMENGKKMISEGHPESDRLERDMKILRQKWARLQELLAQRQQKLLINEKVQQFLYDADEAKSWMSEQELFMMVEDRGKNEFSVQNLMKKHELLERKIEEFAATIHQLGETARQLIADEHPDSEDITANIGQVDTHYAGLKDLAAERRDKLDDALKLFMLNREVDDIEHWIAEKELLTGSFEFGQDYDHATLLIERFREFAKDTDAIGSERVAAVNKIAGSLISIGHPEANTIEQWKRSIFVGWGELQNFMYSMIQRLEDSRERHKYFHDCKDVMSRILYQNHDLSTIQNEVTAIKEKSAKLQAAFCGAKAIEITDLEKEVVSEWMELQGQGESRVIEIDIDIMSIARRLLHNRRDVVIVASLANSVTGTGTC